MTREEREQLRTAKKLGLTLLEWFKARGWEIDGITLPQIAQVEGDDYFQFFLGFKGTPPGPPKREVKVLMVGQKETVN